MSNQEQPSSEPEKEAQITPRRPSYPPADDASVPPPPPAPPPAPGAPSGPALEIERDGAMPPPGPDSFRPVETFEREDVLPSFSDRKPAPAAPPSPVPPVPAPPPAAPVPPVSAVPAPPPPPAAPHSSQPAAPRTPASPARPQPPQDPAPAQTSEAPPAGGEETAALQLAALRSRNRMLKFILVALTGIILLIVGTAAFFYNKIASFFPSAELYQSGAMDSFSSEQAAQLKAVFGGQSPAPGQGQAGSSLFLVKGAGGASGPGGMQGMPQISPEETEAIKRSLEKYADKPLVQEFFADLKKDPSYGPLFSGGKPTPLLVARMMQNPAAIQNLVMKYASRPEFMGLMMEFLNDPDLKPVLGGARMQAMQQLPPAPQPVPSMPQAGEEPEETAPPSGGEPRLDTNAISGPASTRKVAPKTVPAP